MKTTITEADVLEAIAKWWVDHGCGPTIRELKAELGYFGTGVLHTKIMKLIELGLVEWPKSGKKRVWRGMKVADHVVVKSDRIPIVGRVDGSADLVPGTRYVEITPDGQILLDGKRCFAFLP